MTVEEAFLDFSGNKEKNKEVNCSLAETSEESNSLFLPECHLPS